MQSNKKVPFDERAQLFIAHPFYPYWLYCLCHPIVMVMVSALAALLVGSLYRVPMLFTVFVTILSMASFSQLVWFQMFTGHGVSQRKKPSFSFMRIPSALLSTVFLSVIICISLIVFDLFILKTIFIVDSEYLIYYKFVSFSCFISLWTFLFSWRFHVYYVTYHMNEEAVREHYKEKEWYEVDIDLKVENLRKEGKLPVIY